MISNSLKNRMEMMDFSVNQTQFLQRISYDTTFWIEIYLKTFHATVFYHSVALVSQFDISVLCLILLFFEHICTIRMHFVSQHISILKGVFFWQTVGNQNILCSGCQIKLQHQASDCNPMRGSWSTICVMYRQKTIKTLYYQLFLTLLENLMIKNFIYNNS